MAIESEDALLDAAHEALDGDNAQECLSLLARLPVPGLEARALEIVGERKLKQRQTGYPRKRAVCSESAQKRFRVCAFWHFLCLLSATIFRTLCVIPPALLTSRLGK